MQMTIPQLRNTFFALHARLKELNGRWPELCVDQIKETQAALEVIEQELQANGLIVSK